MCKALLKEQNLCTKYSRISKRIELNVMLSAVEASLPRK